MKGKKILITGGTGSWGIELVRQLIPMEVCEIRILARNEYLHYQMNDMFKDERIKKYVGDIKDVKFLCKAMEGVDIVFHLAALKHVPLCEMEPCEAINTNIIGTANVVDVAILKKVSKVIYLSTDKATSSYSTYGLTKALGEKLILDGNRRQNETKFSVLRSGNILVSNGSVIPLFQKKLMNREKISVTHEKMTRFFIGITDGVRRLLKVCNQMKGSEVFVMKMPSLKIINIAEILSEHYQVSCDHISISGIRNGEKLTEDLVTEFESKYLYDYDNDLYVLLNTEPGINNYKTINLHKTNLSRYGSDSVVASKSETIEFLKVNRILS